ncbi:hypothetical protein [Mesorhizobium sp. LjRoot246]
MRKASIAPLPFDWPTPAIGCDGLPHDMAAFIKDRLSNYFLRR